MSFTPDEIANINASVLDAYIDKGKVWKQNIQNKPLLAAFNAAAGSFSGGKGNVSFAVASGQGGGQLVGYTHDDAVSYYNPAGTKRVAFPWKEHHIGMTITHTELKIDGIDIIETSVDASERRMDGREEQVLANILDEKDDQVGEDYARSLDLLLHGDGSTDAKAIAGIRALVLDDPSAGTTGGLGRVANSWWRNRAATAAFAAAGGQGAITSATTNGGALIEFLDKEDRERGRYRRGAAKTRYFCGSAFIDAYKKELRANGTYSNVGWNDGNVDGSMPNPKHAGRVLEYDPTLDDLGYSKRCYALDMSKTGLRMLYMNGQRMKRHNPARPHDRYAMYNGITMTGVLIAKQLNTSGVYDIA